jgi:hypothetical protein
MTTIRTAEVLAVPLDSVEMGRLVFARGAAHLTIRVDGSMEDLYRARFDGKTPEVRVDGGSVTIGYRPSLHRTDGEITLSGRIPWAIEAHWGMSDVVADLETIDLRSLEVSGGISRLEVRLPRPNGSVRVRIGGGAGDVTLFRPIGVPIRVRVGSGVSKLAIDDAPVLSAAGRTEWRSPEYDAAEGRYDIEIGAGASNVAVRT